MSQVPLVPRYGAQPTLPMIELSPAQVRGQHVDGNPQPSCTYSRLSMSQTTRPQVNGQLLTGTRSTLLFLPSTANFLRVLCAVLQALIG